MSEKAKSSNEVWVSGMKTSWMIYPEKSGLCYKYAGRPWQNQTHERPVDYPEELNTNFFLYRNGHSLSRNQFPEAVCVFSKPHFEKVNDFVWVDGFIGVRGKLAEILGQCHRGEGGGLLKVPFFEEDLKTPIGEDIFVLNWGKHEVEIFNPKESIGVREIKNVHTGAKSSWRPTSEDYTISVDKVPDDAPDVWIDPALKRLIFFKGEVVERLRMANLKDDLLLSKCKIVGE